MSFLQLRSPRFGNPLALPMPLIETLTDNFDDNSIDTAKWSTFTDNVGTVTESSQRINLTLGNTSSINEAEFFSRNLYQLKGSSIHAEFNIDISSGNVNSMEWFVGHFGFEKFDSISAPFDNLHLYPAVNGQNFASTGRTLGNGIALSTASPTANHMFLRISELAGTVYWDTSTDGHNWTNLDSIVPTTTTLLSDLNSASMDLYMNTFSLTSGIMNVWMDNLNLSSSVQFTQTLTGSLPLAGVLNKKTFHSFTASMLSVGVLTKQTLKGLTASMLSTGVLSKNTRRALSGSLGISGVLTASHLFFKSLTGALGLSGVLTRRTGKSLTGSLPLSGVLNKKTFHSFTASLTPSGVLTTLKAFTRSLTASMTPSGVLSKRTNRPLSGSLGLSGVLSRVAALKRSLTASMTPSGVLNKRTFRSLTGSMTPHGVVTSLKLFVRSFTASMTPSGTLSKQTRKSLTASISFVGLLTSFIPPIFTPIKRIISSFSNKAADGSSTNIANAGGGVTISDDSSPTNQSSVSSGPNDTIVSSGPNQETLEG